ncbi:nucleoside monophosphate kinase [Candidatus Gracilibacteria bacterium]|nr:nucleoside monophosphate kinase [Candidatus Gracilibacteria bacterium]
MDYIFFGIQGAGKGTQGKLLTEKISAAYFETGGELRRLAHEDSELGHKIKSIIEAGHLVPNEVVMEIVENFVMKVARPDQSIIFDGIPRNQEQSNTFTSLLDRAQRTYTGVYFELSREQAENRLLKRRICSKCKSVFPAFYDKAVCEKCGGELITRADDNADAIKTRIEIFYKETLPVIEGWAKVGKMISINADQPIEKVTVEMMNKLGK